MAVLAVAVGSAPTSAAPVRLGSIPGPAVEGPLLAGDSLFYAEVGSKRRVLRLAGPDGAHRKLATRAVASSSGGEEEESPGDFTSYTTGMAASPQRLAFSEAFASGNARYQVGNAGLTHSGGELSSPFGEIARCSIEGIYGPVSASIDADGPRVATTVCGGGIVIRDYSGATPAERAISPGDGLAAATIAIAGRYIAFNPYASTPSGTSPNRTEVRDWMTGAKVYDVTPQVRSFDLAEDGTLAVSTGAVEDLDCGDGKLSWYSVAEPTEHVLPVKPCTSAVHIAGGRIATVAADGDRRVLALVGLDGSRVDAARLGAAGARRGTIDFDGRRVAFALANCAGGTNLFTEDASAPQPVEPAIACPVSLATDRATLPAGGKRVATTVACASGCQGTVSIRMRVRGRLAVVAERRLRLTPSEACPTGVSYALTLPAAAREEIRRRGTVRAHTIVVAPDLSGRGKVFKRALTLRAGSRPDAGKPRDCAA